MLRWISRVAVACAATACGSDVAPPPVGPAEPPASLPDASAESPVQLALEVTPATVTLGSGESKTVTVTVRGSGREPVELGLDNLPANVSGFIDPLVTAEGNATLTLTAGPVGEARTFDVSLRARAGVANARALVRVALVSTAPSFDVAVAPASIGVAPGDVAGFALSVVRQGGFAGDLTVSVPSLPAGFDADPFVIPASASAGVLNVRTSPLLPQDTNAKLSVSVASDAHGTKTVDLVVAVSPRPGSADVSFGQGGSTYHPMRVGFDAQFLLEDSGQIAFTGAYDQDDVPHPFGVTRLSQMGYPLGSSWTAFVSADSGLEYGGTTRALARFVSNSFVVVGSIPSVEHVESLLAAVVGGPTRQLIHPLCLGEAVSEDVAVVPGSDNTHSIVVAGSCGGTGVTLVRWQSDGTRAPGFGTGGASPLSVTMRDLKMVRHTTGAILTLAGNSSVDVQIARVRDSSGELVASFGVSGVAVLPLAAHRVSRLLAYPDGRVLVALERGALTASVIRLTANGMLDPTFGDAGTAEVDLRRVDTLERQQDGKLIAGGWAAQGSALVRLTDAGQHDATFGLGGVVPLASHAAIVAAREVQARLMVVLVDGGGVSVRRLWP
ncbi:MAG: hypothetical protein KF764_00350 [Labilithrix sp.]|nr:hypothetical protein [Labilithrix sp.]